MRLLIFRPDNIGDVLLFTGALKHIRRKYPNAHIALAVRKHISDLLEGCPYVDSLVAVEDMTWSSILQKKKWRGVYRLTLIIDTLNRQWNKLSKPYDLILYPVKSPQEKHLQILNVLQSKHVIGILGCNVNAPEDGYCAQYRPESLFTSALDVSQQKPNRHELFTTLDYLKYIGCPVYSIEEIHPEVWFDNPEVGAGQICCSKKIRCIGLFPGASDKKKCWAPQNYASLVQLLPAPVHYVILGGADQLPYADEIEKALMWARNDIQITNLVGKTNLKELYNNIKACDLLVSADSCGLHMAIMADIPLVSIVGGMHYGRFFPWGNPMRHSFIVNQLECFGCNYKCLKNNYNCIAGIKPDTVANVIRKLCW